LDYPLKSAEVVIRREDGVPSIGCCRTDQKISIRALYAFLATQVKELGRLLIISGSHDFVRKCPELVSQNLELLIRTKIGKHLLANTPEHYDPRFADQLTEHIDRRIVQITAPSERL
jgi:hypothetical protein